MRETSGHERKRRARCAEKDLGQGKDDWSFGGGGGKI